jgi:hypothetical protein
MTSYSMYAPPLLIMRGSIIIHSHGIGGATAETSGVFVGTSTSVALETNPEEGTTNAGPHGDTAKES